ncbi:MAG: tRNA 2-thiouridine(34) synthase MnmA [Chthonomonadales bacterium]
MSKGLVVAAMSGGVDSAVTAALLKQQGYEVIGITLQIWQEHSDQGKHGGCCSLGAVEDARRASNKLDIPHYVLNFREYFADKVIDRFVSEYARGRTPNPCVECNRSVKFDELLRQARNLGADYLATGHYARIRFNETSGRHELWRALDDRKDQSYALYTLTQEQLSHTLMPLGDLTGKDETRRIAAELGLALANKPDSQEICFVPKSGYTDFLAKKAPETIQPGEIVDTSGKLRGSHEGIANYTIGQRKRLPASGEGPLFVIALEPATNRVIVGSDEELFANGFEAQELCWSAIESAKETLAVSARIRYNGSACRSNIRQTSSGEAIHCQFEEPQRAVTPGQAAVFYDGDVVLCGGTIERTLSASEFEAGSRESVTSLSN